MLELKTRQYVCDRCDAVHLILTNHENKIYGQKCNNWGCTSGYFDFTSMSFYNGEIEEKETNFYNKSDYRNKVKLFFKKGK